MNRVRRLILGAATVIGTAACTSQPPSAAPTVEPAVAVKPAVAVNDQTNPAPSDPTGVASPVTDTSPAMERWRAGTFAGANIYQRLALPAHDPPEILMQGSVVPRYEQSDFDALAATGANLVVLSHPGPFTESPPYHLLPDVLDNLGRLVAMAGKAGLSAVIALRTGPGRNEYTFVGDQAGTWFDRSEIDERVWSDPEAQQAWATMWEKTARRFRGNPTVVGYDLVVEPNASEVLGPDSPQSFALRRAGTTGDWNAFCAQLAAAVRRGDPSTPILVAPDGWASPGWLDIFTPPPVDRLVLNVHLYDPDAFVFHGRGTAASASATAASALAEATAAGQRWDVPVAVLEYGAAASPQAPTFLAETVRAARSRHTSSAVWLWEPAWAEWPRDELAISPRANDGPDPRLQALSTAWRELS